MKDDTLLHETSKNVWTNTRSTQIALLHTLQKQSKGIPFKYEQNKWQKNEQDNWQHLTWQ